VAARAPRTPRANLTNIIFIYRSSPSQNCPDAFSTPKLMSGPILLTPGPLYIRTRAVIHPTGQSHASTSSHILAHMFR